MAPKKAAAVSALVVIALTAATYFVSPSAAEAMRAVAGAVASPLTDLLSAE